MSFGAYFSGVGVGVGVGICVFEQACEQPSAGSFLTEQHD